ncbi:carboxypeptidase-like regulatory domain-containing protein [Flavobacterium sp.]|uniref:carboxypeptidase-like regulatory domain-containing protein n=1 Tax=Flavobacterium sp. TaxID=239 RepID=UPI00261474D9|nr:carboxypeptidase-like regulatory domain-containing protein [Flavobacterium sp.]
MKNKITFLLLIVFNLMFQVQDCNGQDTLKLRGKIIAETKDLVGINIYNESNKNSTISKERGFFEINASKGDTLIFSGIQFIGKTIVLKKEDFQNENFQIKLELLVRNIDEVVVNQYNKINSVSLGIVSKDQKKYTVAERRLRTAGDFKPIHLLAILGGTLPFDPILNAINGRTKMLKKEISIEKKELLFKKIAYDFDDKYFTETLKIPTEYVNGFKYYLVENEKFSDAIMNENKNLATFLMGEIAVEYLKIINQK